MKWRKHWGYLKYVIRHKFYVFKFGRVYGVSLWRLIVHDLSKFSRAEWGPYAEWFYGGLDAKTPWREVGVAIRTFGNSSSIHSMAYHQHKKEFDAAWQHHWETNAHHWEHWANDLLAPLPMPETYAREMVADWCGAGAAQGQATLEVLTFYVATSNKRKLHPDTQAFVEKLLGIRRAGG